MSTSQEPTWGEYYHNITSAMALFRQSNRNLVAAAGLKPGMTVVDLASGTGLAAEAALEAVPEGLRLILIDQSPSMIADARRRLGERVSAYHTADAADVASLVEERVDRVLCNLSLWYFKQPERVLRELRKIVKPTGALGFTLSGTYFNTGGGVVSPQWAFVQALCDQGILKRPLPVVERLPNQRSIEGTLQGAGFKPFLFKVDDIETTAPETEPGGELYNWLQLYPVMDGATREEAVQRTLDLLPGAAERMAVWRPRWRTVTFMAQPQITAEEALLTRFGGKYPR